MKYLRFFSVSAMLICFFACQKEVDAIAGSVTPTFDSIPAARLVNPLIAEGSGIADSKTNPGYLWVQEDSDTPSQLYLLGHNGTVLKKIYIKNTVNRDWEDIVLSGNDLYIADIGDNALIYPDYTIYKFPEPLSSLDTITGAAAIKFKYPDGSHDAEAFLVDPVTKDIYIITKRDMPAGIYKLSYPYAALSTVTLVASLPYFGITGAALSPDGKEIILRTYFKLYHYIRPSGKSIDQALQGNFKNLPYVLEPQGEAVAFANDNSGFFTLSERGFSSEVKLYFYKRR